MDNLRVNSVQVCEKDSLKKTLSYKQILPQPFRCLSLSIFEKYRESFNKKQQGAWSPRTLSQSLQIKLELQSKAALMQKVQESGAGKRKSRLVNIEEVICVDSKVLNYSSFFPGRLLGSTLNVGNLTQSEQIVELSVDQNTFQYSKRLIREKFNNPEIPFSLEDDSASDQSNKKSENIVNSELKHESWWIENPITKELTKKITLKLGPKAE